MAKYKVNSQSLSEEQLTERRVEIAGSRDFTDFYRLNKVCEWIFSVLKISYEDTVIVSGTCHGPDQLGEKFASIHNMKIKQFPANWKLFGKRAGMIRNAQMANYLIDNLCKNLLIAFWDGKSHGTKNMISLALDRKIDTVIVRYDKQVIERYDYSAGEFVRIDL